MLYLTIFSKILQDLLALGWVDWVVTLTALVYVVLAARQNVWGWVWGIVSCGLWAYASFVFYQLWLDALLQIFYVVMGIVGIFKWLGIKWKKSKESDNLSSKPSELPITTLTLRQHGILIIGGTIASILFGYFFDVFTPAAATYLDAFVTVFSIIATFILVQKKLENWAYWVVIDAASVYLFASRGAYLFALLMVIYTIIAANAFLQWRKTMLVEAAAD